MWMESLTDLFWTSFTVVGCCLDGSDLLCADRLALGKSLSGTLIPVSLPAGCQAYLLGLQMLLRFLQLWFKESTEHRWAASCLTSW